MGKFDADAQLQDDLLERLANAPEDILSDVPLIEGQEATKKAVTEINAAVAKVRECALALAGCSGGFDPDL